MGGTASASAVSDCTTTVMATFGAIRATPRFRSRASTRQARGFAITRTALELVAQRDGLLAGVGPDEAMIAVFLARSCPRRCRRGRGPDIDDLFLLACESLEIEQPVGAKLVGEPLAIVEGEALFLASWATSDFGDDPRSRLPGPARTPDRERCRSPRVSRIEE